jgi:photosynthetic reaction center cytochrome c subunit
MTSGTLSLKLPHYILAAVTTDITGGKLMRLPLKRLICLGAIAGLISVFAQAQAPAQTQMSEQAFKNIQVLKGIPVDEFMGTMGLFSAALSVCCGDCHTGAGTSNPQWEADPPRKQIARRMVLMVNNLNRTNFGGRPVVTCWTCHRGSPAPSSTPPIDMIYGEALTFPPDIVLPAPAGSAPTADQLFDKYIQALGGAQRLAGITSYTAKGTSALFGEVKTDAVEIYAKAPNQFTTIVHQKEGDLVRTSDGRNAWFKIPLTVVEVYPLTASALEGGKLDAQLGFPTGIRQLFTSWRASYPATVDGTDVFVVQGTAPGGMIATFYFDKQTGLLNRMVRYANSAVGRVPTQIDYSDYRDVNGVKMPFKWTYGWVSGREEYTMTEYQLNVPVDAAKFARPVPAAR